MEVYNECRSVLGNTFFSCIYICFEKVGGAMKLVLKLIATGIIAYGLWLIGYHNLMFK